MLVYWCIFLYILGWVSGVFACGVQLLGGLSISGILDNALAFRLWDSNYINSQMMHAVSS